MADQAIQLGPAVVTSPDAPSKASKKRQRDSISQLSALLGSKRAVQVTLTCPKGPASQQWRQEVKAVLHGLGPRGSRPLGVTVAADSPERADQPRYWEELMYKLGRQSEPPPDPSSFPDVITGSSQLIALQLIASTRTLHITTLTISCPVELPAPPSLPHLKQLTIDIDDWQQQWQGLATDRTVASAAPHVPRLTSLTVSILRDPSQLFTAPSQTLTHFTISSYNLMTGTLDHLLEYAPALTHVSAYGVALGEDFSDCEWGVEQLTCSGYRPDTDTLHMLPRTVPGPMQLCFTSKEVELYVESAQGLKPELCARLPEWRLKAPTLWLQPDLDQLQRSDRPAALAAALQQLTAGLRGCDAEFKLWDWQLTPEASNAYIQALPGLVACGFRLPSVVLDGTLTDELLTAVLAAGTQIRSLQIDSLSLQSDQHSEAVWPWEELNVGKVSVRDVLRLPSPAGAGVLRKVQCEQLCVNSDLSEADAQRVTDRLQRLTWDAHRCSLAIVLTSPTDLTQHTAVLQRQLPLLRHIRLHSDETLSLVRVRLKACYLTPAVLETLTGLPTHWDSASLCLTNCTWQLPAADCRRLAAVIPSCYSSWLVGELETEAVAALVEGLNAARVRSRVRAGGVRVCFYGDEMCVTVCGQRVEMGGSEKVGAHVTVCYDSSMSYIKGLY